MLRQLFILLLLFVLSACKKDSAESPFFDFLSDSWGGVWHLSEIETGPYGKKYWVNANGTAKDIRILLNDGTMLTADSLQVCCAPKSYLVNGQSLSLPEPAAKYVNPACAIINCEYCAVWDMELRNNQLIITYCKGERLKYVRR